MANRLNAPNQFETLSPPWLLTSLDANATQNQAAWNDSSLGFVNGIPTDTGSANNYQVALPFGSPSAYQAGMTVVFIPANSNTGASTMTVSPLGSLAIVNQAGAALTGGEIPVGYAVTLVCTGTVFRIVGAQYAPITQAFSSSVNQSVACDGANSVVVSYTLTAASVSPQLTLIRLRPGVPVAISVNFASFTSSTLFIGATNPAGGGVTSSFAVLGVSGVQTGLSGSFGAFWVGNGQNIGGNLFMQFQHA
jgi:hypothetical protein